MADLFVQNDNVSEYGDLGDDPEEAEILTRLLADIDQQPDRLVVIDIEDYEPPEGAIVPSTPVQTRAVSEPIQIICDQSSSGECDDGCMAVLMLT